VGQDTSVTNDDTTSGVGPAAAGGVVGLLALTQLVAIPFAVLTLPGLVSVSLWRLANTGLRFLLVVWGVALAALAICLVRRRGVVVVAALLVAISPWLLWATGFGQRGGYRLNLFLLRDLQTDPSGDLLTFVGNAWIYGRLAIGVLVLALLDGGPHGRSLGGSRFPAPCRSIGGAAWGRSSSPSRRRARI
jgi:hypothetical protein